MVDAGGVVIWLGSAREDLVRGTVLGDTKGLTVKAAQTKPHWGDSVPLRPRNLVLQPLALALFPLLSVSSSLTESKRKTHIMV